MLNETLPSGATISTCFGTILRLDDLFNYHYDIEEIALALSNLCRFNGQSRHFYSVAQHSVLVSEYLRQHFPAQSLELQGLLHDAVETYLGDLVRPVKVLMPEFSRLEDQILRAIFAQYRVPGELCLEVKIADDAVLWAEKRDLLGDRVLSGWDTLVRRDVIEFDRLIIPLPPEEARVLFLERFEQLSDHQ